MRADGTGRKAAEQFRTDHGLGLSPITELVDLIDSACGIDVVARPGAEGAHGMTALNSANGDVIIAAATTPHPMRLRSTVAHELGHYLLGHLKGEESVDWGTRAPQEDEAASFARHLLLPATALEHLARDAVTETDISNIVRRFRVSPHVVAIQAWHCELMDAETRDSYKGVFSPDLAVRHGWSEEYQLLSEESQQPRPPRRLVARAIEGYRAGVVSAQTIARLRGVTESTVVSELERAGVRPIEVDPSQFTATEQVLAGVGIDLDDVMNG